MGRQLGLLSDAVVLPEIAYGKQGELSVDWFVIFDDCVVLVEVKSTRPSEPLRLADVHAADVLKRVLGKAIKQLKKSAKLILERHPGFTSVPADRPLVGLVVTMEPFHTVNTPFTAGCLPAPEIPYRICSASELEHLVTITDMSIGRLLMGHMTDAGKAGWSVRSALSEHLRSRNAILDTAWATIPCEPPPLRFAGTHRFAIGPFTPPTLADTHTGWPLRGCIADLVRAGQPDGGAAATRAGMVARKLFAYEAGSQQPVLPRPGRAHPSTSPASLIAVLALW